MKIDKTTAPPALNERPVSEEEKTGMKRVSKQFEAMFVNQMVNEMRKSVAKGGLVPESHAERVYQSMLDYEYSQKISDSEQIGLSKVIYDHLLQKYRGG